MTVQLASGLLLAGLSQLFWTPAPAGGQGEVRVSLFSLFRPTHIALSSGGTGSLKLVAVAEDGRTSETISQRLTVRCGATAPLELYVGQRRIRTARLEARPASGALGVWVGVVDRRDKRLYAGWIEVVEHTDHCRVINHVPTERYVESVACQEIRGAGPEALSAQAVVVRTWMMTNRGRHRQTGFDFCDLTHCQVYMGEAACSAAQRKHLVNASGLVLRFDGRLADVAYFSTCGGHTASAAHVWGPAADRPYLRGVSDGDPAHCARSPHWRWRFVISRQRLCAALAKARPELGAGRCRLEVAETGPGGWVKRVELLAKTTVVLSGEELHLLLGRSFGWGRFKSGNFRLRRRGDQLLFYGRGMGHGVGMCQTGAMGLERHGVDYRAIVQHYFPGTQVGTAP